MRNFILGFISFLFVYDIASISVYHHKQSVKDPSMTWKQNYNKYKKESPIGHAITGWLIMPSAGLYLPLTGRCRSDMLAGSRENPTPARKWFKCNVAQNLISDLIYDN